MGVLTCSVRSCSNIMCDTYIPEIGYICFECQEKFKEYMSRKGIFPLTDREITIALQGFVDEDIDKYGKELPVDIDTFFRKHTREYLI